MLSYEKIFSRARGKIHDPKELSLDEEDLLEIYKERLHSAAGDIRIRSMFSTFSLDDQTEEITWELKNAETSNDSESEEDFVIELLALTMTIEWLRPQVETITYIGKGIGGKEEKVINDSHKLTINRLESLEVKQKKMIRDHGYLYNDYLG